VLVNQQNHDDRVFRLDPTTGQCIAGPFQGHTDFVNSVAYSPDGSHIVSDSDDDTIRDWDISTGQCVAGPFWGHKADHHELSIEDALASFREMYQQEDGWIKLYNAFAGSLRGLGMPFTLPFIL
jgi:WD40 repeat protein